MLLTKAGANLKGEKMRRDNDFNFEFIDFLVFKYTNIKIFLNYIQNICIYICGIYIYKFIYVKRHIHMNYQGVKRLKC